MQACDLKNDDLPQRLIWSDVEPSMMCLINFHFKKRHRFSQMTITPMIVGLIAALIVWLSEPYPMVKISQRYIHMSVSAYFVERYLGPLVLIAMISFIVICIVYVSYDGPKTEALKRLGWIDATLADEFVSHVQSQNGIQTLAEFENFVDKYEYIRRLCATKYVGISAYKDVFQLLQECVKCDQVHCISRRSPIDEVQKMI